MRHLRDLAIPLPLLACYAVLARINPSLAGDIVPFLGFSAAFIVLPALAWGRALIAAPASAAQQIFLGSPAALAVLVCLAYAEAATRIPWLVWLQPASGLLLLAGGLAWRRGTGAQARTVPPDWADVALAAVPLALGLVLVLFKMTWVSPADPAAPVVYYIDDMAMAAYTFAAARAMADGLPVMQCAVAGHPLGYHLFYHFTYAACLQVTGIHPVTLVVYLFPPLLYALYAGAVAAGCRVLARFSTPETALAALLFLFSAGYGFYSAHSIQVFYYFHTYIFGLPAFVLFLAAMHGYLTGRTERLPVLFCALCFFTAAGSKADVLALLPLALLPVLLLRLARRNCRPGELALGALCILAAVGLKFMLYAHTERAVQHFDMGLVKLLVKSAGPLKEMVLILGAYAALLLFAADASRAVAAVVRRQGQYLLFAITFVLASCVLLKLFNLVGGTQYLYWHARLAFLLAFAPVAAHILKWRTPGYRAPLVLLLLAGLGFGAWHLVPVEGGKGTPLVRHANALFPDEREALDWAFRNIPHGKTFFTNRDHYIGSYMGAYIRHEYFDYLAFSGLQGYSWPTKDLVGAMQRDAQERFAAQSAFLAAPDAEEAGRALARIGANYYIHAERRGTVFVPPGLVAVHRTPAITIYENTLADRGGADHGK